MSTRCSSYIALFVKPRILVEVGRLFTPQYRYPVISCWVWEALDDWQVLFPTPGISLFDQKWEHQNPSCATGWFYQTFWRLSACAVLLVSHYCFLYTTVTRTVLPQLLGIFQSFLVASDTLMGSLRKSYCFYDMNRAVAILLGSSLRL